MRKYSMLISLIMVLFFCSAFKLESDSYNFTREYQSSSGTVIFDHEAHAVDRNKDCVKCHNALEIFGGEVSELFAHNYCKTCHESQNGPTDCNGCHDRKKGALK